MDFRREPERCGHRDPSAGYMNGPSVAGLGCLVVGGRGSCRPARPLGGRGQPWGSGVSGSVCRDAVQIGCGNRADDDGVPHSVAERPHMGIGRGKRRRGRVHVLADAVVDDVDEGRGRDAGDVAQRLDGDQAPRHAGAHERVDDDRVKARVAQAGDERTAFGVAHAQSRRSSQPEMLARQGEDVGVDLAHFLTPGGILGRERPRQGTRAAPHVHDPPGVEDPEHDPHPAHVVELEVRGVGEIDIRRVHIALAQQASGRAPGVALGHQLAPPGNDLGHRSQRTHARQAATTGHRAPGTGHRAPGTGHRPPAPGARAPANLNHVVQPSRVTRTIVAGLLVLVVLASGQALAPANASAGAASPAASAPYGVGEIVVKYTDHSRTVALPGIGRVPRPIATVIRYPISGDPSRVDVRRALAARGPFPLIVFAHGFAVTPAPYAALMRAWVSAGYVVAAPIFPLSNANALGGPDESDLVNQPRDMSFVITRVLTASAHGHGTLAGRINASAIAVAGQSDGGSTALDAAYDHVKP